MRDEDFDEMPFSRNRRTGMRRYGEARCSRCETYYCPDVEKCPGCGYHPDDRERDAMVPTEKVE